jgi:hypothetical protein
MRPFRFPARAGRKPGPRRGTMNKLESRFAEVLEVRRLGGEIAAWWWESMTLKLAQDCRLTVDFMVLMHDGEVRLYETKGFMRDDALVKLKVCAEKVPFRIFLCKYKGMVWTEEEVCP